MLFLFCTEPTALAAVIFHEWVKNTWMEDTSNALNQT